MPVQSFPTQPSSLSRGKRSTGTPVAIAFALILASSFFSPVVAQIPVTVAWEPNEDGITAGYELAVGITRGIPVVWLDVGAATSVTLPLPPGALYYVSVRAYTTNGLFGPGTPDALVDVSAAPGAPDALRSSVAGAVVTLRWSPPNDGGVPSRYLLSVGTSPGASNLLSEAQVGSALSVSGALPSGTYYARLQAGNMLGIGPPTPDVVFQVGAPTPALPAPTGVALSASGRTVRLQWRAVPGAAAYLVEAGSTRGATDLGVFNVGHTTSVVASVPPGTYYVRLRAVNGDSVSSASIEMSVQVR